MRRQVRKGVTLIELLVVVAILVFLAGVVFPVGIRAVHRAKVTSSMSKLRQLHLATAMYRTEYDGDGNYGDMGTMGLPPVLYVLRKRFGLPEAMMQSACGNHPSEVRSVLNIVYCPGEGGPRFEEEASLYQENLVLYYDMNCTDSSVMLHSQYESKLGIGVLLGGNAVIRRKPGDYWTAAWWADPPP